jgi:phosphopantothenoylcysteine decarboxylase
VAREYSPAAYAAMEAAAAALVSPPEPAGGGVAAVAQPPLLPLLTDDHEWAGYRSVRRDPVVHIELRRWADCLLFAPLSANTLGKLACGLCDNLATCVARAWEMPPPEDERRRRRAAADSVSVGGPGAGGGGDSDGGSARLLWKPFLVAPAMNTAMWEHPATAGHLATLAGWGVEVIPPVVKLLACGDTGTGAMAAVETVVDAVATALRQAGWALDRLGLPK